MLTESLTAADCHIVSLKPALEGLMVPSKIYSTLAAGRAVIFIGAADGEVARLMMTPDPVGNVVTPEDVDGLVASIEHLSSSGVAAAQGEAARRLFDRMYDQPLALAKWLAVFTSLGVRN